MVNRFCWRIAMFCTIFWLTAGLIVSGVGCLYWFWRFSFLHKMYNELKCRLSVTQDKLQQCRSFTDIQSAEIKSLNNQLQEVLYGLSREKNNIQ
jgi:hypothetical protein